MRDDGPTMLSVAEVLGPGGLLARSLPGWETRPQQLDMALQVEAALRERRPTLIEAGTGTGKTLGYLVPAILSGLRVVVSTGTRNLQEQILKKDVPLLAEHLPVEFTVTQLKGMSNYLCRRRYGEFVAMQQARGDDTLALHELRLWAERTAVGDRAELPELPDDSPLWREISATTETRLGPRCPFHESCFVTRARREAQRADVLVVNHHLYFADLALRDKWPQAQLLPAYDAVIFDEAHQVEEVATDYFGLQVSSLRLARLAGDLGQAAAASHVEARATETARHLATTADSLFTMLRERLPREGRTHADDALWSGEATRAWHALDNALEEAEGVAAQTDDSVEGAERGQALSRRARVIREELAVMGERHDRERVYWAERRGRTVLLHASPVDVAEALRETLFAQVETAVFTSATLTAEGRFDYVQSRLGLDAASTLRLDSPFDYRAQALLYLPRDLPEPAARDFVPLAAARSLALVEAAGGRAFLLYTSHRQMVAVHALLAPRLRALSLPALLQGERPKHLLLAEFRRAPSVLFATGAFWEGVDVVGDALQLVVIDKLPFAPPDDPLVSARVRRLEEAGQSGFRAYQIPQAALALAQGFGRLIRHRGDRGLVAILDPRASSRGYGHRVLSSLPADCPRTADLNEARRFLRRLRAARANVLNDAPDLGGSDPC